MSKLTRQLQQLTQELAGVAVQTSTGRGEIDKLVVRGNGDLAIQLSSGRTLTVPRIATYLNSTVLTGATYIVRQMRKRGIIGSVIGFVKLVALLIFLIVASAVVLGVLGIRALLRK